MRARIRTDRLVQSPAWNEQVRGEEGQENIPPRPCEAEAWPVSGQDSGDAWAMLALTRVLARTLDCAFEFGCLRNVRGACPFRRVSSIVKPCFVVVVVPQRGIVKVGR